MHEQGLVSVLRQIHEDLDAAVFEAYGWPATLTDEQILEKLVALNAERAAEEKRGLIRWLRPEFQNRDGGATGAKPHTQGELDLPDAPDKSARSRGNRSKSTIIKQPWPAAMSEQAKALRAVLTNQPAPASAKDLAKFFKRAKVERIEELLETLASLGQARRDTDGRYSA